MNNPRLTYLFELQVSKKATNSEKDELMALLAEEQNEEQAKVLFAEAWDKFDASGTVFSAELSRSMLKYVLEQDEPVVVNRKGLKLWPRIAVAAASLAVIVSSVYFYNRHTTLKITPKTAVVNDIAPGKNGASITLANGKVIQLSDAKSGVVVGQEIKYDDGTALSGLQGHPDVKSGGGMTLTASTAKGQTYQFTLPDGTKVWLNAESKISFPSQFTGKERKILLEGEGYFEVVHNAKQPFRVESKGQVVEDIGTEFNINAYTDESNAKTTLVEGSAKIVSVAGNDERTLTPNQQATLYDGAIKVTAVNTGEAIAWKEGYFRFNGQRLGDIMKQLERWYNIEVRYEGDIANVAFSARIDRNKNISQVLGMLEKTKGVHFKIEGRRVTAIE